MSDHPAHTQDQPAPEPSPRPAIGPAGNSGRTLPPEIIAHVATKGDETLWQDHILSLVEHQRKGGTTTYLQNVQVCLDFVKQHGYPTGGPEGYTFVAHHGILEVFTEKESFERDFGDQNSECFILVRRCFSLLQLT